MNPAWKMAAFFFVIQKAICHRTSRTSGRQKKDSRKFLSLISCTPKEKEKKTTSGIKFKDELLIIQQKKYSQKIKRQKLIAKQPGLDLNIKPS